MKEEKVLLGYTKREQYGEARPIFLYDFSWECGWYWGGGYIGNKDMHAHFDGAFLNTPDIRGHCLGSFITPWSEKPKYASNPVVIRNGCSVWEDVSIFLDKSPFTGVKWWRIKDLFKQFYALRKAAEVFRYGGHCDSRGRNEEEINPDMAKMINLHIQNVIIPEIRKIVGFKSDSPKMS